MEQDIVKRMRASFQKIEGGLFSSVQKADVGDAAQRLQSEGVTLMCWADPFFPDPVLPQHVAKRTADAILDGTSGHYTAPIGNTELKIALAKRIEAVNGLKVDPKRHILITPGSDAGLFYAMLPFIEDGDEVMIPDPSYPNNFQNTDILGGSIVRVPLYPEHEWQFRIEDFEERVSDKTKMVVLTHPNNPTAVVYRREKLVQLAEFVQKHDLVLVVDQAFEEPVFDDIEMVSMAALPGMWERTVSVFSFSKGMGLSGFRVGYIVADDVIMDKLFGAAVTVIGAANTAAQIGAIAALEDPAFMATYRSIHDKRRRFVHEQLSDIPGVTMRLSESGFLSWVDVSKLGSEEEVLDYLIKHARVAVNGGSNYGEFGRGYIRIVHGVLAGNDDFEDAILRIREALTALSREKQVEVKECRRC